jgi:hypothetical protein
MLRTGRLAASVDQGNAAYGVRKMRFVVKAVRLAMFSSLPCIETVVASLSNAAPFSMLRGWYWRRRGYSCAKSWFIVRNVCFSGVVPIREGSPVSNNCLFNGSAVEMRIGNRVMIAPDCVFVAFDHGYRDLSVPMIDQPPVDAPIAVEDDVWIGANSTIAGGRAARQRRLHPGGVDSLAHVLVRCGVTA